MPLKCLPLKFNLVTYGNYVHTIIIIIRILFLLSLMIIILITAFV